MVPINKTKYESSISTLVNRFLENFLSPLNVNILFLKVINPNIVIKRAPNTLRIPEKSLKLPRFFNMSLPLALLYSRTTSDVSIKPSISNTGLELKKNITKGDGLNKTRYPNREY
jgi:hypothetical protein